MMRKGTLALIWTLLASTLLITSAWVSPSVASECNEACTPCHGNPEDVHVNFSHDATLGSGQVAIFPDNGHDDAGWTGTKPYFAVSVDCSICHNYDLPPIHGNDCATCHPTPYDTLGTWSGGCQQGGCHTSFHQDSTTAHSPFEDPYDPENDCYRCHLNNFEVQQFKCLNCHAAYTSGDVTPPVTTSDAQASYYGPAKINFSIIDNGKVGIGRTFYRLDGGPVTAGSYVLVDAPGSHALEFWSKDQYGNTELASSSVFFSVVEDTTPPTTTSNAQASYSQGATINLIATDDSPLGVKATYYRIDANPIQTGTTVVIPATPGSFTYTLTFWSEDWAGNVEAQKSVSFTVASGDGILRLSWGTANTSGSPCAGDPDAEAAWTVRSGGWTGPIVASGADGCPQTNGNWSGVNDIILPVTTTSYYVRVDWWDSYYEWDDQTDFPNVYLSTPGQVILLQY